MFRGLHSLKLEGIAPSCGWMSRHSPHQVRPACSTLAIAYWAAGSSRVRPPDLYRPMPLTILNNGHTIQVNAPPGSRLEVNGTT